MTEKEELERGHEARRLLAEPLLIEAFAAIEATILSEIRRVDVGAAEKQRDLIVTMQLLAKVRTYIENVALTGRMAEEKKAERSLLQRFTRR